MTYKGDFLFYCPYVIIGVLADSVGFLRLKKCKMEIRNYAFWIKDMDSIIREQVANLLVVH